ncbi:MAG: YbbR-like domain-containing protein [Planctomycetota bacterium]|jgi:hypothetical protein
MTRKIKYGKAILVVFLTALIWIWADLAQDDTYTVPHATIAVAKSLDPSLWVAFGDAASYTVDQIVLKGPASKITAVEREISTGLLTFVFFLDPTQEAMTDPGKHSLDVQSFLRKSSLIRKRGLAVDSCSPKSIQVSVAKLVERSLKVRCMDDAGIEIKNADIDPTHVKMFVPADWEGIRLIADVPLSPREIEQARAGAFSGTPQIELAGGRIRKAGTTVIVRILGQETVLADQTITGANLAIALSVNLLGDYDVEVMNQTQVERPFQIKATDEAKDAYQKQPFQMTLYILDGDEKTQEEQTREVFYNLPEDFVRNDQIMPPLLRAEARFKLIPLASGEGSSTGGS